MKYSGHPPSDGHPTGGDETHPCPSGGTAQSSYITQHNGGNIIRAANEASEKFSQ